VNREKQLRTCEKGHTFYKRTDCKSCPTCNQLEKPTSGFLSKVHASVRNALLSKGIDTIEKLAMHTKEDILALHGIGPSSLPIFNKALEEAGLSFKPSTLS